MPSASPETRTSVVTRAAVRGRVGARARRAFVVIAVIEAVTWAGLLVGMLLEHVLHVTDVGVYVFGRLHGGAFLLYCAAAVITWWCQRWHPLVGLTALAAGVPPFGTVVMERWLRRRGHLDASPAAGVRYVSPATPSSSSGR